MTEPTQYPRKQILFALLSAADFALTWWLLDRPGGEAYEANPVAGWWLARHGWLGLACFKAAAVCLVLGLAAVISRSRPRAAGHILKLGCACLALVVAYSAALGGTTLRAEDDDAVVARLNAELEGANRQVAAENERRRPFLALIEEVRDALLAGRCTLYEAAERLAASQETRRTDLLRGLAFDYPDSDTTERFACWIVYRAVDSLRHDPPAARSHALRLTEEFRSTYGPLPPYLCAQVGVSPTERIASASSDSSAGTVR